MTKLTLSPLLLTILSLGACLSDPAGSSRNGVRHQAGPVECATSVHAVIRDFRPEHPDFERAVGTMRGLVELQLGPDGLPVYAPAGATRVTEGADAFNQWYRDVPGVNQRFEIELPLTTTSEGYRVYDNQEYFPIDGQGFGETTLPNGEQHNFHFTSEIHEYFVYNGGEEFSFRGDDDVWVFVNGHLAIDLGGVHAPLSGSVRFDEIASDAGLTLGGVYSFDVFHAERHVVQSSLRFETSACFIPDADGDGVPGPEDCDDDDAAVGRLLYENDFTDDDLYFQNGPGLTDTWNYEGGALSPTRGGQQALIGAPETWTNTVTYARVSARGFERKCSNCGYRARSAGGASITIDDVTFRFDESGVFRIDRASSTAAIYGSATDDAGARHDVRIDLAGLGADGDEETFEFVGGSINGPGTSIPLSAGDEPLRFGPSLLSDDVLGVSGALRSGPSDVTVTLDVFERDRFRAGILARTAIDADQDEGYHGYRCAVARNSEIDCAEPGRFVQLASFMDAEEDDIHSECTTDCSVNTTFEELGRTERSTSTDLLTGDAATLMFWAYGADLTCEFTGTDGEHVVTRGIDESFTAGAAGLSTLNAFGAFDSIRVCEALAAR